MSKGKQGGQTNTGGGGGRPSGSGFQTNGQQNTGGDRVDLRPEDLFQQPGGSNQFMQDLMNQGQGPIQQA